jgi:hypothetical protein
LKDMMCFANVLMRPFHIHEWCDNFYPLFISDLYFALLC